MSSLHGKNFIPLPPGPLRIILVANVARLDYNLLDDLEGGPLTNGDIVVEFNTARHHQAILEYERRHGVAPAHYLIVRNKGRLSWNSPTSFDGFSFVYFTPRVGGLAAYPWFKKYGNETNGKAPTTGFAIYQALRSMRPDAQITLFGFDPIGDTTSEHCNKHAWAYEADWYEKNNVKILK